MAFDPISYAATRRIFRGGIRTCGFMGDSRLLTATSNPYDVGGTVYRTGQIGLGNWLHILTKGRLYPLREFQTAFSGKTSAQVEADLPRILNGVTKPDVVVHLASVNDSTENGTTIPYGTSANTVERTIRALSDAGIFVIAIPEVPRTVGWGDDRQRQHSRVRQRVYDLQTELPNVLVPDTWAVLADDLGNPKSGLYYDNTHPSPLGNFLIAKVIADKVNQLWAQPVFLPAANVGYWNANENPIGLMTVNPMMTGTGGTKTVGTAGTVTGEVADSYVLTNAPSGANSNFSIVGSKVTDTDGKIWQQVTVTGTAAGATERIEFYQTFAQANVTVGDRVVGMAEIQVDAGTTAMWGPSLEIGFTGGTPTNSGAGPIVNWGTSGAGNGPPVALAYSGPLLTPPYTLPSAPTGARLSLFVRGEQGVAGTITFRVRNFGMRMLKK